MMSPIWRRLVQWLGLLIMTAVLGFAPESVALSTNQPSGLITTPSSPQSVAARKKKRRRKTKKPKPETETETETETESTETPEPEPTPPAPAPAPEPTPTEPTPIEETATEHGAEIAGSETGSSTSQSVATTDEEEEEEEVVDFDEEETESDRQAKRIVSAAGGHPHADTGVGFGGVGFKLFVDMLADYRVGSDTFEFRPNHFYVLLQAQVNDDLALTVHVSDDPVFYELTWNITPHLAFKAGKLLVPFGANEFHHLFGGRVDELSHFLPETWGDFGIGMTHMAFDGDYFNVEYALYVVNGFQGSVETGGPIFAENKGSDNNLAKGFGTRVKVGILGKAVVTGSLYWDMWDPESKHSMVFYAVGLELRPGLIPLPGLRKLRLRGEWGRGEIQIPQENVQRGLIKYAKGRGGMYAEALYPVLDQLAARIRVGRINPDNRITDGGDVNVLEPALLVMLGKLSFTFAYQLVQQVGESYSAKAPADVAYVKFFLQF